MKVYECLDGFANDLVIALGPSVLDTMPFSLPSSVVQPNTNIIKHSILLQLYSDQHWRSAATCAAALGLLNLNYIQELT